MNPGPRPPRPAPARTLVPGPLETAVAAWRWLRRMRTALYLLGLLALATLLATIVPQRPNVPVTVDDWLAGVEGPGAGVARLLDAFGAFDVFGAPWFMLLLALLFTSLTACLVPRYRAWWRVVRRARPPGSRSLEAQPHVARLATDATLDEALAVAAGVLARRRYRVSVAGAAGTTAPAPDEVADARAAVRTLPPEAARGPQVAAERGHVAREGGSLAFHTAFYVLVVAIVAGQLLGFSGQVGIVEGERWADTAVGYWASTPGRWWSGDDHRGFVVGLDRFEVDWHEDGTPAFFFSHVTVEPADGGEPYAARIGGNDPLVVDGMKVHQLDWGYAPRVVVLFGGEVVHDAFIPLIATTGSHWRGVVKAPAAAPDIGLELFLVPSAPEGADGQPVLGTWPGADAPLLLFRLWRGDLRLEQAQNVFELDLTALEETGGGQLRPGFGAQLPGEVTIAFPELRRWVGVQVSHRPTVPLLLTGSGLLLAGLLPALYAYRRRIWVEAAADPSTAAVIVTVAGTAFQRPHVFGDEHRSVVAAIADALAARPARGATRHEVVRR